MREIERGAKHEAEQAAGTSDTSAVLEPYEDCDVDDGESDWSDASNAASPAFKSNRRKWRDKQSHAGKTCSSVEEVTGYTWRVPEVY